jgi:hypothetical protein
VEDRLERHLFTYRHDGSEWVIEIPARDAADARARIGKLVHATYDGKLIAKVPAVLGPLAKLTAWLRNATRVR